VDSSPLAKRLSCVSAPTALPKTYPVFELQFFLKCFKLKSSVRVSLLGNRRGEKLMHILLVEDSSTLSHLFQVQLRQLGHTITIVETKAEAIAVCEKEKFDLIFIDMGLEGLPDRGLEILAEIKIMIPDQRIGILSSNDLRDMVRLSQEKGADFYMVKPFTMEGLSVVLAGDKKAMQNYQPEIGEGRILVLS
jgi:CheY-like chemotaxis protein